MEKYRKPIRNRVHEILTGLGLLNTSYLKIASKVFASRKLAESILDEMNKSLKCQKLMQ